MVHNKKIDLIIHLSPDQDSQSVILNHRFSVRFDFLFGSGKTYYTPQFNMPILIYILII